MNNDENQIIEIMADIEHQRWTNWQKYVHSILEPIRTIPPLYWERWERQINTSYSSLSEKEKDSDRLEVQTTINALKKAGFIIKKENEPINT